MKSPIESVEISEILALDHGGLLRLVMRERSWLVARGLKAAAARARHRERNEARKRLDRVYG